MINIIIIIVTNVIITITNKIIILIKVIMAP